MYLCKEKENLYTDMSIGFTILLNSIKYMI
jgi:hypothetical protein